MAIPHYWNEPEVISVNTKKPKSYFIPFDKSDEACTRREDSSRFTLLNDTWRFRYYETVQDLEDDFCNLTDLSWDEISVPGMWQTNGYDVAAYVSSPYPFMFDPPYVPERNPLGLYSYTFDFVRKENKEYDIVFEGVDSCLYLYLNGSFVGYSEVSHNEKVFDVTDCLVDGKNTIYACVLKRCTGSYFEDQDKIRMNGIFRDVYILERDAIHIYDLFIKSTLSAISCDITLNTGVACVDAMIYAPDGEKLAERLVEVSKSTSTTFDIADPILWSSESPSLYTIILKCGDEVINVKRGLCDAKIENGVFKFNGKKVKIKGVNRHDTHYKNGYCCSYEDMRDSLLMMKRFNVNTVRCSHYPNEPRFYELCDELGMYVINEADLETHGCAYIGNFDYLSELPEYKHIYLDRVERMIEAQKNHTCIIMWSMCNESGWGENLAACCDLTHRKNKDWIVHCESAFTLRNFKQKEHVESTVKYIDVYSNMYSQIDTYIKDFFECEYENRPFFLTEYSHAMGNSCGDLKDYWDVIYSNDRFIGGCVWEWRDHTIQLQNDKGEKYFGYGGDFGDDVLNLYNYCADGLTAPNGSPHPSLYELKQVYSPVYIESVGDKIRILNRYNFTSLSHLRFCECIKCNGKKILENDFKVTALPDEISEHIIPQTDIFGESFYTVEVFDGDNSIYIWQKCLSIEIDTEELKLNKQIEAVDKGSFVYVNGDNFLYKFSKIEPLVKEIVSFGKTCCMGNEFVLYRAPIDNDNKVKLSWSNGGAICAEGNLRYVYADAKKCTVEKKDQYVRIIYDAKVGTLAKKPLLRGKIVYTVYSDGALNIDLDLDLRKTDVWVPRIGLKWNFVADFEKARYFGFGPHESYIDRHNSCVMDVFEKRTEDFFYPYLKPQECGSVYNAKWASIISDNARISFVGDAFSFNVSEYSLCELADAKHPYELHKDTFLNVYTDVFMSGVGSASCGPELMDKYKIKEGRIRFSLSLFNKNDSDEFEQLKKHNKIKAESCL